MNRTARLLSLALMTLTLAACGGGSGGRFAHKNFLMPTATGRAAPDVTALGTLTSLVAGNGRFYVGGQTGVAAINPDGSVAWMKQQPPALLRLVSVANGKVAASAFDSPAIKDLTAFLRGKIELTATASASVTLFSDAGEALWTAPLANPDWLSAPTIHSSTVAVQSGSAFHIFSMENGSVVMTAAMPIAVQISAKFPLRQGRTQPARIGDNYVVAWGNTRLVMAQTGKEVSRMVADDGFYYSGAVEAGGAAMFSRAGMERYNGVVELDGNGMQEPRRAFATHDCFDLATIGSGFLVRCGETLVRIGKKPEPSWTVKGKAAAPSLFGMASADDDMRGGAYGFGKMVSVSGIPARLTANFDAARTHSALGSIVVGGNGHIALASRDATGDVVTVLDEKKGQYVGSIRANGSIVGLGGAASTLAIATSTGVQLLAMP